MALLSKAGLAGLFIAAGMAKMSDPNSFIATIRLFMSRGAPEVILRVLAFITIGSEILLGGASMLFPRISAIDLIILAATGVFVVVAAVGFLFHRGQSCRCFGALSTKRFDGPGFLRSCLVAVSAILATLRMPAHAFSSFTQLDRVLLICAGALLAGACVTASKALALTSKAMAGPRSAR